jgi:uncharacterized protein
MENIEVKNDEGKQQFAADVDGKKAFIDYKKQNDGTLNLLHTEVPPEFEGKGIGSQLVKQTLEQIKAEGAKIIPSCRFVAAYIKRHKEYESLIAD